MSRQSWTPERLAARLRTMADEHGAPNQFHLNELAPDGVLAVCAVARFRMPEVNKWLEGYRLHAFYLARSKAGVPACIKVEAS